VQDAAAVGHVDDLGVIGDFGDEVARVQVVGDGHAQAQDQAIRVEFQDVFDPGLGVGVEAVAEIGRVGFGEGLAG